jgi:hypothetical protein
MRRTRTQVGPARQECRVATGSRVLPALTVSDNLDSLIPNPRAGLNTGNSGLARF